MGPGKLGPMFRFAPLIAAALLATPVAAQTLPIEEEITFITKVFSRIQERSFALNKELCGYVGYNRAGELDITRIMEGEEAACYLPNWPAGMEVIASFHTHSTYSPDYDSEVPSSTDMETDEEDGIDGWVATPGGRLWYIDSSEMIAFQVCGIGCLPMDPNFVPGPEGAIKESYTYRAILKSEAY